MPIVFASISPHPPIILPSVGSKEDREKVKKTIESLEFLGRELKKASPDKVIISAPHPDWGFNVPLFFLARRLRRPKATSSAEGRSLGEGGLPKDFKGEIEQILIGLESPRFYFEEGTKFPISNFQFPNKSQIPDSKIALIASGDLSHCLKEDGPYGFHPDGPKFDKKLIEALKKKDIETILKLDEMYPEAGECGLRSFCFLLGILEASGLNWQPEILSYEGPFGVGYLVADFKF